MNTITPAQMDALFRAAMRRAAYAVLAGVTLSMTLRFADDPFLCCAFAMLALLLWIRSRT